MSLIHFILAAGSLPALIFGAPVPSLPSRDVAPAADIHSLDKRASYTVFGGNGQISDGWPAVHDWVSNFDDMFNTNKNIMFSSCGNLQGHPENDSEEEINDIYNAIQSVSKSSGVDARFILAIVMQESNGCVRVQTTNYGVNNPGLMQSHNGKGTCNPGTPISPCPSDTILQMITDGTEGTLDQGANGGPGLKQLIEQAESKYHATDATKYYIAARLYNAGSVPDNLNLGAAGATACYSSDVANRLLGWSSGATQCNGNIIGSLTAAQGSFTPANNSGSSSSSPSDTPAPSSTAPATSATAAPTPTTTTTPPAPEPTETTPPPPPAPTPATPTTTTTPPTPPSAPASAASPTATGPVYPGAVSNCKKYVLVMSGDYCLEVEEDMGVSASQFLALNPGLDAACTNLWLGYEYCISTST
ncbi:muramidase, putative [Talaromyces stipitatus ATCC 10500]|uniref:Muramidase, putative n=1 Tax=Talaromyces stipitatus (strain ATCC 10500 / CBS 375.48 / QM 6759 / NRRL 1006) TaxID=441959 RepID=B8MGN0_TALSN|nr:muramidase, putative [Talaromyces stipitatus ATCC 10500]EED16781.1 muramidase, putative [Talaromyces stipitatus ATCC 10500]